MKNNFPIQNTAKFNHADGKYTPVTYQTTLHDRINHRASENSAYHIKNCYFGLNREIDRKQRYEELCLENGKRPYGYPDVKWEEYLRDYAHEEHTAICEAKNDWMYQH